MKLEIMSEKEAVNSENNKNAVSYLSMNSFTVHKGIRQFYYFN